jgi:ABC-type transport system involved in multi-copper enzyme maturation permease subunit
MNDRSSSNRDSPSTTAGSGDEAGQPIHHLGYRGWSGQREPAWTRFLVIAAAGVRRAWQNNWLKRMLFFAWLPAIWFGVAFFLWEQAALYPEWHSMATPILRNLPRTPVFEEIRKAVDKGNFSDSRHTIWSWLLQSFFLYPQAVLMVLIIGLIAPPLISQDIRSRAFLLYFSRPLTRGEYLLGKMASLWAYLAMISAAPALSLYLIGVVLSPSLSVTIATWDLPLRILAASVVLMLPTSALALCLSSMTQETRSAGFAWFAVWILGWFTYFAVTTAEAFNTQKQVLKGNRAFVVTESVWTHLSLFHTLGRVQSWVFGFDEFKDVMASIAILIGLTVFSLAVMFHRISAPMRA